MRFWKFEKSNLEEILENEITENEKEDLDNLDSNNIDSVNNVDADQDNFSDNDNLSSNEDDSYWQDTPGHYVTTFLYDAQTDKIFLGDSGNPDHNRQWVKLRKIYKALKTASGYQFMTVTEYDTTKNKWKRNKITDKWVDPAELTYIAEE